MCSSLVRAMENNNYNHQGDLTDILRGGPFGGAASASDEPPSSYHWQQQQLDNDATSSCYFGDPFSTMRDPFLHELHIPPSSSYFEEPPLPPPPPPPPPTLATPPVYNSYGGGAHLHQHEMRSSSCSASSSSISCNNIFSNMIQISPSANNTSSSSSSPRPAAIKASPSSSSSSSMLSNSMVNATSIPSNKQDCHLLDNAAALQISSPRNPALKRRKNQAKKVVCIPAPAAANSRQTGEVVPSDLWAWRKYGQKPIKGSPYPRGYYRCSSSKGCSARKQVERSRTDPNMLVITYTSEHNHPWPTQRNALAGSTRSQPSKNSNNSSSNANNNNASSKNSEPSKVCGNNNNKLKEENSNQQQEMSSEGGSASVKEEMDHHHHQQHSNHELELELELDNDEEFSDGLSYKPSMIEEGGNNNNNNNQSSEDFFADLGEIEADPLNLLFSSSHQGYNAGGGGGGDDQRESKALDPFNIFDWSSSGGDTNSNNNSSFEEPNNNKGRL
ncbi:WRKY Transcription Factor [Stylosanthes scabra]|uniref:WRKY Transcription Factor n=1 Tax=Stylosanthes scabra TaxID=79078 RepID=A0ABU6SEC0_9FABA|nr:WRKY Transcription Factor [Stylosanthes scabra]